MATQPRLREESTPQLSATEALEAEEKQRRLAEFIRSIKPVTIKGEPLSETIVRMRGED